MHSSLACLACLAYLIRLVCLVCLTRIICLICLICLVCLICLIGRVAVTALRIWTTVHLRRFKLDAEDNLLARKHFTQMRILERAGVTLVALLTISIALMTFEPVRQYGVSLLASAGAAGLILGPTRSPRSPHPRFGSAA